MSELQQVAECVANVVSNAKSSTALLHSSVAQLDKIFSSLQMVMQDSSRRDYIDILNQLSTAGKKIKNAQNCLMQASMLGETWIKAHTAPSSGSATPASVVPSVFSDEADDAEDDVKVKKLTEEEANERYKRGLEDIDERLEIHKEALMERGVPDGEWLRKTLATEKALMTHQLSNDIEVARGQAEPQNIYNIAESGDDGSYKFYDDLAQLYFNDRATIGPCIDWKKQPDCNITNTTLNLNKTNPNYNPENEWGINCQRCVPTYEMRRRGYDVTAFPKVDVNDYLCRHPFDVWKNPTVIRPTGAGQESIVEKMTEWGDGARAQVVVVWRGVPSGHTFIVENVQGKIRFIDPQSGDEDCSRYFNLVEDDQTLFCRIDNLIPSDYIVQCCREV